MDKPDTVYQGLNNEGRAAATGSTSIEQVKHQSNYFPIRHKSNFFHKALKISLTLQYNAIGKKSTNATSTPNQQSKSKMRFISQECASIMLK